MSKTFELAHISCFLADPGTPQPSNIPGMDTKKEELRWVSTGRAVVRCWLLCGLVVAGNKLSIFLGLTDPKCKPATMLHVDYVFLFKFNFACPRHRLNWKPAIFCFCLPSGFMRYASKSDEPVFSAVAH